MRRKRSALLFSIALVVLAVLPPAPAQAHTSSYYYGDRWGVSTIRYGMHRGFPGGAYRDVHLNGKNQWNIKGDDREPDFYWALADDVNYGSPAAPCQRTLNTGALYWRDLDYLGSGVLGATRRCASRRNTILTFTIEFDSDQNWYVGTGDAPRGRPDWWSVVTHEFGHATGFSGHFGEGESICPNNGTRHTMCPFIYAGTERQRTLEAHDIHTFDGAY